MFHWIQKNSNYNTFECQSCTDSSLCWHCHVWRSLNSLFWRMCLRCLQSSQMSFTMTILHLCSERMSQSSTKAISASLKVWYMSEQYQFKVIFFLITPRTAAAIVRALFARSTMLNLTLTIFRATTVMMIRPSKPSPLTRTTELYFYLHQKHNSLRWSSWRIWVCQRMRLNMGKYLMLKVWRTLCITMREQTHCTCWIKKVYL